MRAHLVTLVQRACDVLRERSHERDRIEKALQENEHRLRKQAEELEERISYSKHIIDTVREPLLVLDEKLTITSANRSFYETFKVTPEATENQLIYETGNREWDIPALRKLLEEILPKSRFVNDFEVESFPTIGPRTMLLNARIIVRGTDRAQYIVLAIEDITDRKRVEEALKDSEEKLRKQAQELEQQLIASGRLVSVGELTASMAHEFNNPLGIVLGFVQDLLTDMNPSDPNYGSLKIIDEEAKRCQNLVRELLEYGRPKNADFILTDVKELIQNTLDLILPRVNQQKVEGISEVEPDLPRIPADPQQLQQVLANLCLNALDAMPGGGTLTVSAKANSSNEMIITVADTGLGMDADTRSKIFLPFFTAGKRKGLGLGLPICERIVKFHGGSIEVESAPGQGTTLRVHLPINHTAERKPIAEVGPG